VAALVRSILPTESAQSELLGFRARIVAIYAFLIAVNLAAWIWAFVAFSHQPVLIGTAVLAYSLGLRHAIDADHIAAIDNVTRKLMQEGKRPPSASFSRSGIRPLWWSPRSRWR
jgi:high-affinity nickel-transport protein